MTKLLVAILLLGLTLVQAAIIRECHPKNELKCDNGQCIKNEEWCDRKLDCSDGSDEYHCYKETCPDGYLTCNNKRCVPESAICNGYDNCGDRSDEKCNGSSTYVKKTSRRGKRDPGKSRISAKEAVIKAAEYLIRKRISDYGWGSFTPRAVIALSFADGVFEISEQDITLMKKHLDVEILLYLNRNKGNLNLIDLSLYINALYSTCQNPRNFNGLDLVDLLWSETNREMQKDFNLPLVLMTLCIANGKEYFNATRLISMYDDVINDRIGFKALTVMAMAACKRHVASPHKRWEMQRRMQMFTRSRPQNGFADVYTEALTLQALNAMGSDVRHDLWARQLSDGSFGDLLATYYAIPVLLNMSLLNLTCNGPRYDEASVGVSVSNNSPKKKIAYSLWISQEEDAEDVESHTMFITLEGNKTLYDAMMEAKSRDPMFDFTCDETPGGKKFVYSLGGLPNDAETGMYWMLYRGAGRNYLESRSSLREEIRQGIENVFPKDGSHFVFWRKRKFRQNSTLKKT